MLDELRTLSAGIDDALVSDLVGMLLADAPCRLQAMATGLQSLDLPAVGAAAHSLKAAAGNLGARELQELCEQLQFAAQAEDAALVSCLVPQAVTAFAAAKEALLAALEQA